MAWSNVREALDLVPTPSRAVVTNGMPRFFEPDCQKDVVRLEQEESDRRFFADPPDDFVRCPNCSVVYAVQVSRPTSPCDPACVVHTPVSCVSPTPTLPASYSKELPRGANLSFEESLRHMRRSRFRCSQCDANFCRCSVTPYHWGWSCDGWQKHKQLSLEGKGCPVGSCRWCAKPCMANIRRSESLESHSCENEEGTDLRRYPPLLSCAEKERRVCGKRLCCGHLCGGVRGECECLPCLHSSCRVKATSSETKSWGNECRITSCSSTSLVCMPDGEEWCPICWTETLHGAPAIHLNCGHVLHHHCVEAMIRKGSSSGRRLSFKSIKCPLCQALMGHPSINKILHDRLVLYHKVRRKALQRWVVENRQPALREYDSVDEERIATLAMSKMSFFECSQCNEPYYGGEVGCGAGEEPDDEELHEDVQAALAMELVCRGCSSKGQLQCSEHGTDFLGWKCRYCCEREAQYFCFGTTHFCHSCHELWQTGVEQRRRLQAGKPCLGRDRCIFGGLHPSSCRNGRDEYALGCTICAQDAETGVLVHRDLRSSKRKLIKRCCIM